MIDLDFSYAEIALDKTIETNFLTKEYYECEGEGVTIDWPDILPED